MTTSSLHGQADETPIDHAHLSRYTLGDATLELEILQLFAGQAPQVLDQLRQARDARAWHAATHTLKGSAKAVGARRLAEAAETAERAGFGHAATDSLLADVERALAETVGYVERIAVAA